jgi:GT2 family glycosyltransferase
MSDSDLTATVGVVTYGRPEHVADLLESLLEQTLVPPEILVVDDSHADRTRETIGAYRDRFARAGADLRYLARVGPDSMPGARNTVLNCSDGDIVCFLDDDVVCSPEWFETVLGVFEHQLDVTAVGGPAISVDGELELRREVRRDPENQNRIDAFGRTVSRAKNWIPPEPVDTQRLEGANMSFRREALAEVGGFDLDYDRGPAKFEEVDTMARLVRRGDRLVYHPDALVHHFEASEGGARAAMRRVDLEEQYWFARNYVLFRRKNARVPFWLSVAHLVVTGVTSPWRVRRFVGATLSGDWSQLYRLRGYLDGIVFDRSG